MSYTGEGGDPVLYTGEESRLSERGLRLEWGRGSCPTRVGEGMLLCTGEGAS